MEVIDIIMGWMEGEVNAAIKVWVTASISLSYCYFAGKFLPGGPLRLFALIPAVTLNLLLPLNLHTLHLGGSAAFFLAWLANFKLLLFAFSDGPLSDPSISLPRFLAVASLPIKINQPDPSSKIPKKGLKSSWNYAIKFLLIAVILRIYDYSEYLNHNVLFIIYSLHIYLGLETLLAIAGGAARAMVGVELEPQFNEPYLSSSLQDFWSRRWNIMVTRILRPTVYEPALRASSWAFGRKWAPLPAIMATFMVSALMHELIFYYLGRTWPTWEITCFFILNGSCLMAEVAAKKAVDGRGWQLPRIVAAPLTVGLVMVTSFWLFFPPFLRFNAMERAFGEYAAMGRFVKDIGHVLISNVSTMVC